MALLCGNASDGWSHIIATRLASSSDRNACYNQDERTALGDRVRDRAFCGELSVAKGGRNFRVFSAAPCALESQKKFTGIESVETIPVQFLLIAHFASNRVSSGRDVGAHSAHIFPRTTDSIAACDEGESDEEQ